MKECIEKIEPEPQVESPKIEYLRFPKFMKGVARIESDNIIFVNLNEI